MSESPDRARDRSIELEVEVQGTPEEVWRAIATGPGISSWYVPHQVDEREGGAAMASFGDAPEMQVAGRVAAWEPPSRIVFDGGDGVEGLAFEWLVQARDGGTCVVRLVNSGFGSGEEWDDQYDGMTEGWGLFLFNLQLHCRHFPGRQAVPMLPTGGSPLPRVDGWTKLRTRLGIVDPPTVDQHIEAHTGDGASLAGTVVRADLYSVALLLDAPAPGTAFLTAEGGEAGCGVSVWSYLYGPDAAAIVERDKPRWQAFLDTLADA
jgi:uncharacterized protein YndB with AHSA1/START domain